MKGKKFKKGNLHSTNNNQFQHIKEGKNVGGKDRREVSGTKGEKGEKGVILIDVHRSDYHVLVMEMTENEVVNEVENEVEEEGEIVKEVVKRKDKKRG